MLGTTVIVSSTIVPLMGGGNVRKQGFNSNPFCYFVYFFLIHSMYGLFELKQAEKAEVINTLLFVSGLNTLLQTFFGTRLPVVIGGSYVFIIPAVSIALSSRYSFLTDPREVHLFVLLLLLNVNDIQSLTFNGDDLFIQRFKESMRDVQGALIVASFFTMTIGFFGFWRVFAR